MLWIVIHKSQILHKIIKKRGSKLLKNNGDTIGSEVNISAIADMNFTA